MQKLIDFLSSRVFFYVILGLFTVEAVWIALSAAYPMAFDEDFHLGIIRLYAHHISPFWSQQPANADVFGPVYRDPSYLYHWFMSFPYRFISLFTHSQTIQVVVLRLLNVGLFASALPLLRKLLLKTGANSSTVHVVLLVFILLPVTPQLAAQINYDNLFIPLVALAMLTAVRLDSTLSRFKRIDATALSQLIVLSLLTSLVKYVFLPMLAALTIYFCIRFYWYLGRRHTFWRTLAFGIASMGKRFRLGMAILVILAVGLFLQRYAVNMINYHYPLPVCEKALSVERCESYGPWARDYSLKLLKHDPGDGPAGYMGDWFYGMWLRTFFALAGPALQFETRGPLRVPASAAIVFAATGVLTFAVYARRIFRRYNAPVLWLLIVMCVAYIVVLWLDNYASYVHTGTPVAINGRYLLAVYPTIILLMAIGYIEALRRFAGLKLLVGTVVVLSMLWGGGALTYIVRSRDAWLWQSPAVRHANYTARRLLDPVIPGGGQPTLYLR